MQDKKYQMILVEDFLNSILGHFSHENNRRLDWTFKPELNAYQILDDTEHLENKERIDILRKHLKKYGYQITYQGLITN